AATVSVDAGAPLGPLRRIWTSFGYDEINWTSTPTGKRHLKTIAAFAEQPYFVRSHYIFNSGIGWSLPHWGAGNVYHEDAAGGPFYDFAIADQVYDAVVHAGHRPLVELAFTPRALVPEGAEKAFAFEPSPTQWSPYEAGLWAMPPRDYERWGALVRALVEHCVARYGAGHVRGWLWELWNEPDIFYWRGTPEQFWALYDVTAAAVKAALPDAAVGGPTSTGDLGPGRRGNEFLRGLRAHRRAARLRVVSHEGRTLHALARLRPSRRPGAGEAVAVEPQDAARGSRGARRGLGAPEVPRLAVHRGRMRRLGARALGRLRQRELRLSQHRVLPGLPVQADEEAPRPGRARRRPRPSGDHLEL